MQRRTAATPTSVCLLLRHDSAKRSQWLSTTAKNLGRYLPGVQRITQGKDFELILTVIMETRHPVKGPFGREFPAICNDCGVTTAWSRKTGKFCEKNYCAFWGGEMIPLKLSLLHGLRPKSARSSFPHLAQCSRFHPNWFTFGTVIAECIKTVFAPYNKDAIEILSVSTSPGDYQNSFTINSKTVLKSSSKIWPHPKHVRALPGNTFGTLLGRITCMQCTNATYR